MRRLCGVALAGLALGGCAVGTSRPTAVGLSILAPTNGSTVGVRAIQLVGKVTPSNAVVIVGHRAVRVHGGTFRQPLILLSPVTHIAIRARATGLRGASTVIAVRYSPKIFARHARPRSHVQATSMSAPQSIARGEKTVVDQLTGPDFVAGCSNSSGGQVSYCTCVWNRMKSAGLGTTDKLKALVASWRRSLLTKGVIVYPPALRSAVTGCVSQLSQP